MVPLCEKCLFKDCHPHRHTHTHGGWLKKRSILFRASGPSFSWQLVFGSATCSWPPFTPFTTFSICLSFSVELSSHSQDSLCLSVWKLQLRSMQYIFGSDQRRLQPVLPCPPHVKPPFFEPNCVKVVCSFRHFKHKNHSALKLAGRPTVAAKNGYA